MSKAQQLQARAATLPEQIAGEVLDFLEFVAAKRAQEQSQSSATKVSTSPRTVVVTRAKLPTFKGGAILADPHKMKQLLYGSHE